MKIKKYLDIIEDKKVLNILRILVQSQNQYSGRSLGNLTGMSHRTCRKYLDHLVKHGILSKKLTASSYLYSLNHNYFTDKVLIPLIIQEQNLFRSIQNKIVKQFSGFCKAIIIFGSYANNKETENSDLDICFMIYKSQPEFHKKLEQTLAEIQQNYELIISPYILTLDEVRKKKNLDIIKEIRLEGIWIYGTRSKIKELW